MCKNAELYLIKLRKIHQYFSQELQFVKEKFLEKNEKIEGDKVITH